MKKEDEDFQKVKDFLRKSPDCTVLVVSEGTGVPMESIEYFLDQGRLEGSARRLVTVCSGCNKETRGRLVCEKCTQKVLEELSSVKSELKEKTRTKAPESAIFSGRFKL